MSFSFNTWVKLFVCISIPLLSSCASTYSTQQPQVNSLVVANHLERAIGYLGDDPHVYGDNNELLYWLDRGLVLHLAGQYEQSARVFQEAKRVFNDLYTQSVSQIASSWLANDYWAAYRGEDYEYVLVTIFQALNYAAMGKMDEALVESRDVDNQLALINARYGADKKNVYRDDAFARFLAGAFYEASKTAQGINDAYIANRRAFEVYERDYKQYGLGPLKLLQANLLTTAAAMGDLELKEIQDKVKGIAWSRIDEKNAKAEVYLVQYCGFVPVKVADVFPVPIDRSHVTKLSFPKYAERFNEVAMSRLVAQGQYTDITFAPAEIAEDIGAIARSVLANRKAMIIAKSVLRPAGKYVLQKSAEGAVRKKYGDLSADVANVVGNLYNMYSEQADLRSWQTLPNDIRVARLLLAPGAYQLRVESFDDKNNDLGSQELGKVTLKAGDKRFFIVRTYR